MVQLKNLKPTVQIVSIMIVICKFIIDGGDGFDLVASAIDIADDLIQNVERVGINGRFLLLRWSIGRSSSRWL